MSGVGLPHRAAKEKGRGGEEEEGNERGVRKRRRNGGEREGIE